MSVVEEMNRLAERYAELETAKDAVEDLIMTMEEVDSSLPSGIEGSHHADMEWGDTLEQMKMKCEKLKTGLGE